MKFSSPFSVLLLVASLAPIAHAQVQDSSDGMVRPRRVAIAVQEPAQTPAAKQLPTVAAPQTKPEITTETPAEIKPQSPEQGSATTAEKSTNPETSEPPEKSTISRQLTATMVRSRIAEAERLLKTRPRPTALVTPSIEFVTLAALDQSSSRIHLLTVSKESFLTKGSEVAMTTSFGMPVTLRILRANGVNTAVTVFDNAGLSLVPLVIEFPIEKQKVFREMAYYTSAHPALLSSEVVITGHSYVRSMVDLAVKRLREKGVFISPIIVNVAERLCIVEHVDHDRFRLENRIALFDEIYSLYALNELDTYRYSVSFAGAGGMVQMIPWAYNLERQRHPGVGLIPDFVVGMRTHANALQAMLLYMQDTWSDLSANEDVQYALNAKVATTSELLAAAYNSNAARLPLYIRRGGQEWRSFIPRETQMYLQIYKTLDALVPMKERVSAEPGDPNISN
jgi:hypothetical protein